MSSTTNRISGGLSVGRRYSAYQVERLAARRRRRPEHLAALRHTPNMVRDGDTGDVACDHYRRYARGRRA